MAYTINRYNGAVQATVQDGTINQSTEVKFIGKNYAGYGEAQNENFMFLLEHFAGSTAPSKPVAGMIWYDNSTQKIKVYNGTSFKNTGSTEVSTSAPSGLVEGDLWWNSTTGQLYVKNASSEWILVGPQGGSASTITRMVSTTLTDTLNTTHDVQEAVIGDEVVYIISKDEFTNSAGTSVTGFDVIRKGITLVNTVASTDGITSTAHRFWGTASNAIKLNGIAASNYVTSDSSAFTSTVAFSDLGYTLGLGADLIVKIDTDNETPMIQLVRNLLRVKNSSGTIIYYLDATGIHPNAGSAYDLGKAGTKWQTVYADTFSGIATQAGLLTVGATGRAASTAATANTIAARDASGDLYANLFQGTATKARYADLAEKYSTKEELAPGTAVAVCACEDHDVEPANASNHCIGVVSTDPAYMMNSEATGQYIGLKGRLPVRVKGAVKKGQAVYAMADGVCTTLATTALVGIALESNDSADEKLVECVLKV
jgi:hypothetical protein